MSEALEQSDVRGGYKEIQFGPKTLVIPSDWSTEQFGDIFYRRRESIDDLKHKTVKYVGLKHIDSGQLKINGYDEDGRERSSSRVFREGDVLFGKLRPNLNKAAVAPFSGVCSSDILPIYVEDDAGQRYLPYLMHSNIVRDRVVSTMEGTNLPRTSWGDLENTLIPLPSPPEQRRIADILSTVDEQIQQTDKIIEKTKQFKRGLMQDIFLRGLRSENRNTVQIGPKEYQLPTSWEVVPAGEVCEKITVGIVSGATEHYQDDGVPFIRTKNIEENNINTNDMKYIDPSFHQENLGSELRTGDVITARTGEPGTTCVIPSKFDGANCFSLLITRTGEDLDENYFSYFMNSPYTTDFINSRKGGGVQKNLNVKFLRKLPVFLPKLEEQRGISSIIGQADQRYDEERETKQRLQELKRGLMQDLLTGKVRVNTD